eukprot:4247771-Karenia_brevis.AAC.1
MDPSASGGAGYTFVDIDISNCFPSLLFNFVSDVEGDERARDLFPFLYSYSKYKTAWRGLIAEAWGINMKKAKKMLIALNHNGQPHLDDPLLWALARDFRRATDVLLDADAFKYVQDRFGARKNPVGTRVHYALAAIEDNIITALENAVQDIDDLWVNTLMFDGLILRIRLADYEQLMQILTEVGNRWGVVFESTQF